MKSVLHSVFSASLFVLALGFSSCSDDEVTQPNVEITQFGGSDTLGNGIMTSYVKLDRNNNPIEVGVRFPDSCLQGLDPATPISAVMTLPESRLKTAIDHISFDWTPNGHPPVRIYDVPHFDVHFYTISQASRDSIPFGPDGVDPATYSNYYPASFKADEVAIPGMGVHFLDTTSHEFHGTAFNKTFVYGFFKGKLAFLEPMITKAYLETRPNSVSDIPQPAAWQRTGLYYPTKYRITYDEATRRYTVSLSNMVLR